MQRRISKPRVFHTSRMPPERYREKRSLSLSHRQSTVEIYIFHLYQTTTWNKAVYIQTCSAGRVLSLSRAHNRHGKESLLVIRPGGRLMSVYIYLVVKLSILCGHRLCSSPLKLKLLQSHIFLGRLRIGNIFLPLFLSRFGKNCKPPPGCWGYSL